MGPLTAASHRAYRLTTREVAMLCRASEGWTNAMIAREWGLAERTVRQQLVAAYRTLGVRDRTAAVVALVIAVRRAVSAIAEETTVDGSARAIAPLPQPWCLTTDHPACDVPKRYAATR